MISRRQLDSCGRDSRSKRFVLLAGGALLALGAGAQTTAALTPVRPTVKVGKDYAYNRAIVVTGYDRAVYRKVGETTRRITCTGACTVKWPPVTVPSATSRLVKGAGVTGTLSKFRRPDGKWQVALRGYPLYRYSPDHSGGDARGNGEGGVWYTLRP